MFAMYSIVAPKPDLSCWEQVKPSFNANELVSLTVYILYSEFNEHFVSSC